MFSFLWSEFDAKIVTMSRPVHPPSGSNSWRTLKEWYDEPHDYEWLTQHRSSRAIQPLFRVLLGIMTIIFGITAIFKLIGPDAPPTLFGKYLAISVVVGCFLVAAFWFTQPFPGRRGLIAFVIFADIGFAGAVLMVIDRESATFGCIAFVVSGTYATLFVSARWLLAHVVWATGVSIIVFFLAFQEANADTTTLIARALVLFTAVTLLPIFSHLTWRTLYRDARFSDRDPLTGLLNRRGLEPAILDLFEHARAEQWSLAFVVVDIDKFKLVNDVHGHFEGDQVIKRTADRLSTHLGQRAVIGRIGGEEYLAAISGPIQLISVLIGGIVEAISSHPDAIPTTVSVGAVIMPTESKAWTGGSTAIAVASNVADSMMYQAKAAGGNSLRTAEI